MISWFIVYIIKIYLQNSGLRNKVRLSFELIVQKPPNFQNNYIFAPNYVKKQQCMDEFTF